MTPADAGAADGSGVRPAGEVPGSLRVGVVSDTHGKFFPGLLELFRGVDHIMHAGDVGTPEVLSRLRELAPLTAVRGNVDTGALAWDLPAQTEVELGGVRILIGHDIGELLRLNRPAEEGYQVVVTGHSHRPAVERENGVLFLNPGSAGPRRFHLPRAAALLDIKEGRASAEIVILERGGRP